MKSFNIWNQMFYGGGTIAYKCLKTLCLKLIITI